MPANLDGFMSITAAIYKEKGFQKGRLFWGSIQGAAKKDCMALFERVFSEGNFSEDFFS